MIGSAAALCAVLLAGTPGIAAAAGAPDSPSQADAPERRVRLIATLGYDFAVGEGVELRVVTRDGANTSAAPLNGGVVFAAGVGFSPPWPVPLELRATLGVKDSAAVTVGGQLTYRAFPIELLAAWGARSVRATAGLSASIEPSVRGADLVGSIDTRLETSIGVVGQVEWVQRDAGARLGSSFGARVLWQTLRARGGGSLGSSAIGLFAGLSY